MLRNRKSEREGQSVDVVACAIFSFAIDFCLQWRAHSQKEPVRVLLSNLQDERGELSCQSAIFRANRGYSREDVIELLLLMKEFNGQCNHLCNHQLYKMDKNVRDVEQTQKVAKFIIDDNGCMGAEPSLQKSWLHENEALR